MATQYQQKLNRLKAYVSNTKYIDTEEQPKVCKKFGLHYVKSVFQIEYRRRFYEYLKSNIATVRMVSHFTGIPPQYLTHVKRYYEKKGLLKVLFIDIDPLSNRGNVQFLSCNPMNWNKEYKTNKDQLSLFELEDKGYKKE